MARPDRDDHPFNQCANCGDSFQFDVEYPVTTRVENDGTAIYSFCDGKCQEEWETERGLR